MRKRLTMFFIVIAIMTIGYASRNAVIRFNMDSKLMMDLEDFKFELKSVNLNNTDISSSISSDKQSFNFFANIGTEPVTVSYGVSNLSTEYDSEVSLECEPAHNGISITQESIPIKAQEYAENTISFKNNSNESSSTCEFENGFIWNLDYSTSEQNFMIPCNGTYSIEYAGAQGGKGQGSHNQTQSPEPGYPGEAFIAEVELHKNDNLSYIIGSAGKNGSVGGAGGVPGGANGKSANISSSQVVLAGGGGGGGGYTALKLNDNDYLSAAGGAGGRGGADASHSGRAGGAGGSYEVDTSNLNITETTGNSSGNGYIHITLVESSPDVIEYTCRLNVQGVSRTVKAENCSMTPGDTVEYNYTGDVQEFNVPCDGIYELTAYGAGGENKANSPGKGSTASGKIELSQSDKIYVYVGTQANTFNGGGVGECQTTNTIGTKLTSGNGCGATDFRLVPSIAADKWSGNDSLESRIVTAGGGGGTSVVAGRVWSSGIATDNTSNFSAILYSNYDNSNVESNNTLGTGSSCVTGGATLDNGDQGYTASGGGGGGYYGGTTISYNLTGTYDSVVSSKNGVNAEGKSINNWLVVNSEHVIGSNVGAHAGTSLVKDSYTLAGKTYTITNAKVTENVTTTSGKAIIKYIGNK